MVSDDCAQVFLDNFQEIHDWVEPKYAKKVMVVVDTQNILSYFDIVKILRHRIVINGLWFLTDTYIF